MGHSRFVLRSPATCVSYQVGDDPRMEWARKAPVGVKKYGGVRQALVASVPKVREYLASRTARGSAVVALDFRNGNLHVDLVNPTCSNSSAYAVDDKVTWAAFDRHLNEYVENPGRIVIGADVLTADRYDLEFESSVYGDCLTLVEKIWKGRQLEGYGSVVHVNLSAVFTFGGLTVHTDGTVRWPWKEGDDVVAGWTPRHGEVSPFFLVAVGDSLRARQAFMRRGFERMCAWTPHLRDIAWCEAMYNADRGGSPEATIARFREILAALPR